MRYLTNCTESTGELIDAMVETEQEIEYAALLGYVKQEELDRVFPFYVGLEHLSLESDYAVSYYTGIYDANECVFVVHSAIEYIFINH